MASFNVRHGGNTIRIPEGFNFNPQNFGTARLNYRINSNSVGKLGLTTNTNAKDYCKFQMRVGGQTVYIGRVSSTSYISGAAVNYNGSSTTNRSLSISESSEVKGGPNQTPVVIQTSSMSTKTEKFTKVTSQKTAMETYAAGNGNGTAAANPTIRTVTNNTGSSVTTRTANEAVLTRQDISWTGYDWQETRYTSFYTYNYATAVNNTRSYTEKISWYQLLTLWTRNASGQHATGVVGGSTAGVATKSWATNFGATATTAGAWANANSVSNSTNGNPQTKSGSYYHSRTNRYKQTTKKQNKTLTTSYWARQTTYNKVNGQNTKVMANYYSTRWSYWWTSCKKSTGTTNYTGTTYYTSFTSSTTSVTETMHNMNL